MNKENKDPMPQTPISVDSSSDSDFEFDTTIEDEEISDCSLEIVFYAEPAGPEMDVKTVLQEITKKEEVSNEVLNK